MIQTKPCRMCGFPTDTAVLFRNFKYCREEVCTACMHNMNKKNRIEYKKSKGGLYGK